MDEKQRWVKTDPAGLVFLSFDDCVDACVAYMKQGGISCTYNIFKVLKGDKVLGYRAWHDGQIFKDIWQLSFVHCGSVMGTICNATKSGNLEWNKISPN